MKVAFFALLHDQALNTRIQAFARDEAGNEAKATFIDNVFEKPFKNSRIELDDKFINRVVPEILEHSPELKIAPPAEGSPEMLPGVPEDQRRAAEDQRRADRGAGARDVARRGCGTARSCSSGNSQVEARFADHRTYFYKGKEVDQQVHLGFDLAVTDARAGPRRQRRHGA